MKSGQIKPNEFETAILEQIALEEPALSQLISKLHVLSREFTGVGSYTNFDCSDSAPELEGKTPGKNVEISMPLVPNGLGVVLFCEKGKPCVLEIFAYGDEHWDGVHQGFSFVKKQ